MNDIAYEGDQFRFQGYLKLAEKAKDDGNAAFAREDRSAAIEAYSEAMERMRDALEQNPDEEQVAKAVTFLAICLSNRAAAYLMDGEGMDAMKAVRDGEKAESVDPNYVKA
jgi:hypothetical protein